MTPQLHGQWAPPWHNTLTAAGLADQRHSLPCSYRQVHATEDLHVWARGVAEVHARQLNRAAQLLQGLSTAGISNLRLAVDDLRKQTRGWGAERWGLQLVKRHAYRSGQHLPHPGSSSLAGDEVLHGECDMSQICT